MTVLYVTLSILPIIQVDNRLTFALKIATLVVVTNLIGLLIYRRSSRNASSSASV
jgi:hypothetical protein